MKVLLLVGAVFKIVLWILLIALIVAFIMLAALLFCGIKYEAVGDFGGSNKKAGGFVSWLFSLVRVDFSYSETGFEYNIKLPFKKLFFRKKKQEKPSPPIEKSNGTAATAMDGEASDNRVVTAMDSETSRNNSIKSDVTENNKAKEASEKAASKKNNKKNKKKEKKEKNLFVKLTEAYYEYDAKSLYAPLKRFLKRLARAIGVRKARANLIFGFDDPSLTGIILGGGCAAAAFLPVDLQLKGHFDGAFLDGNAVIKGKTCVFAILIPAVRLVLEKPVWKFIKKL